MSQQDTRTHVVGELYDTERSYVESLQILVEKYMKPLKSLESNRLLVESSLVDEIFYTVPDLLQHHENFLSALQDRLSSDWDTSQVIGDVFIEAFTNQQIIDTYTAFINNWKNARQAIKVASQAKPAFERFLEPANQAPAPLRHFRNFLQAMSREHRNKLTLDALLIMPVQRIPRYELLIKELIKHTPDEHPDRGPLRSAQKQIHELALKIDRAEREMINQEKLKDLEALIEGHVELQGQQREFVRYDLVSILSGSFALATKKERVLFLFCDLLIMTSVKKKASRRSNLQTAFVNSSNDLALLEGNKFKLLLKVPLDQVEIRQANEQQKPELQQQLRAEQAKLQERRRLLEADLSLVRQMEALSNRVSSEHRQRLGESIGELASQLSQRLASLEPQAQENAAVPQAPPASSSSQSASPAPNQPASQASSGGQLTNQTMAAEDANTSLEFIISTAPAGSGPRESLSANLSSSSAGNENCSVSISSTVAAAEGASAENAPIENNNNNQQQAPAGESLVVTFASLERRQAFLAAFVEVKQNRSQLQRQQRMFSTSLTLRLAQPTGSARLLARPEGRLLGRSPLRSGQSVSPSRMVAAAAALESNQTSPCSIVHQMSAPQSLAEEFPASSSPASSSEIHCQLQKPAGHHHHHHQLIHQPASQPASLDTICCHDKHNGPEQLDFSSSLTQLAQLRPQDHYRRPDYGSGPAANDDLMTNLAAGSGRLKGPASGGSAPSFLVTIPSSFLGAEHHALQFTCAAPLAAHFGASPTLPAKQNRNRNKLWLCLSNNYVSHLALVEIKSERQPASQQTACQHLFYLGSPTGADIAEGIKFYNIWPALEAAGDICKSHINCLLQVKWAGSPNVAAPTGSCEMNKGQALPDVAIKSASPPMDIANLDCRAAANQQRKPEAELARLSESAPSPGTAALESATAAAAAAATSGNLNSASTSRLELPGAGSDKRPLNPNEFEAPGSADRDPNQPSARRLKCCELPGPACSPQQQQQHHPPNPGPQATDRTSGLSDYRPRQQHHYGNHQAHNLYRARHHTVPIGELRRELERNRAAGERAPAEPEAGGEPRLSCSSPSSSAEQMGAGAETFGGAPRAGGATTTNRLIEPSARAATSPPEARPGGARSFRSARALRHQASLKTSSILAKLVMGAAGKRANSKTAAKTRTSSEEKKKSASQKSAKECEQQSDGNETDGDFRRPPELADAPLDRALLRPAESSNPLLVSPLSSFSSLNSNSSINLNSTCASSPARSTCDFLSAHSLSTGCCAIASSAPTAASVLQQSLAPALRCVGLSTPEAACSTSGASGDCTGALRCRSATMPSRRTLEEQLDSGSSAEGSYKVSEIVGDEQQAELEAKAAPEVEQANSLWLGCDDGSLVIIDCLAKLANNCQACAPDEPARRQPLPACANLHPEVKLPAAVCDMCIYKDKSVFVALANGQLAVFSRTSDIDSNKDNQNWALATPKILTLSQNELNSSSRLCLIEPESCLWYSYGRNIYVLELDNLKLQTTIMAPTNDLSLQFQVQSITIDKMQLMDSLQGVWISFKNSHLIQLYNFRRFKLIIELNLFDCVSKILSYGNEIIRQHKTACLKATAMLSVPRDTSTSTLFIGTSAGIILYLELTSGEPLPLPARAASAGSGDPATCSASGAPNLSVFSLQHGHAGQVKFLELVELEEEEEKLGGDEERRAGRMLLVSGGPGVELYGPAGNGELGGPEQWSLNGDEDSTNHLLFWKL